MQRDSRLLYKLQLKGVSGSSSGFFRETDPFGFLLILFTLVVHKQSKYKHYGANHSFKLPCN